MSDPNTGNEQNIEDKKWKSEFELREREVRIREKETESKLKESERSHFTSPLVLAVIAAAVGAFGNAYIAWYNASEQRGLESKRATEQHKLEDQKAEASLIIEIIKTRNNAEKAVSDIVLLIQTGLIVDKAEVISTYFRKRVVGQGLSLFPIDGASKKVGVEGACAEEDGKHIVSDVDWEDKDGGLLLRSTPNGTPIGVMPSTATGILVESCLSKPGVAGDQGTWCQVRYKCTTGWAFSRYLSPRASRLSRVVGIDVRRGLEVRNAPSAAANLAGALGSTVDDVVVHVCQEIEGRRWCQISKGKIVGWVANENLQPRVSSASSITSTTQAK